jgi:phosphosulfolactate synthase
MFHHGWNLDALGSTDVLIRGHPHSTVVPVVPTGMSQKRLLWSFAGSSGMHVAPGTVESMSSRRNRKVQYSGSVHTSDYLERIGVPHVSAATSPFDPGYDPATVASHLQQSFHLMSILKISMACWLIADERATRRKIQLAHKYGVPTVTGGGPFEIAVAQGELPGYLDLCADVGVTRIECGQGFTESDLKPREIVAAAASHGLDVQMELGKKHDGAFNQQTLNAWLDRGQEWLDAGAVQLVVEARESAQGVGLFDANGNLNTEFAECFVTRFGFDTVMFEAPNKPSQFALLKHFGRQIHLCNVRLEELLRVEIFRRGLHSDAFELPNLRPVRPSLVMA